jgi:hypothetical protein
MGTPQALHEVSNFVEAIEARTGLKIGCLEEVAYRNGYINGHMLEDALGAMPSGEYRNYILRILYDGEQEKTTVDPGRKGLSNPTSSPTDRGKGNKE